MKVLKFGGTSVGSKEALDNCIAIISREAHEGKERIAVVVSAFSGVTDQLKNTCLQASEGNTTYRETLTSLQKRHHDTIRALTPLPEQPRVLAYVQQAFNQLEEGLRGVYALREANPRILDMFMGFGERLSAYIITQTLRSRGVNAIYTDARELIKTDSAFGSAHVLPEESAKRIQEYFADSEGIPIITGFIGSTVLGRTTTLGRGGSDYTAAIIGAYANASCIEIWTDVDGVMTADPRKVSEARLVEHLSYIEALELSHFGAKVIYPPTMLPAMERQIPLWIKNTFNPTAPGTLINSISNAPSAAIKGLSSISSLALLRIEGPGMIGLVGAASKVFSALSKASINIVLITQASSEYSICIAVSPTDADVAKQSIEEEFSLEVRTGRIKPVAVEHDRAIVTIVGERMRKTPGVAGTLFETLGSNGINTVAIAQGSSELSISTVIEAKDEHRALNAIHAAFFKPVRKESISIFLIGTGLIGRQLLAILLKNQNEIEQRMGKKISLVGLANSTRSVFEQNGIPISQWKEILENGHTATLERFVETVKNLTVPNKVWIDCTASTILPFFYETLLRAGIPVVTPNKKGLSASYFQYKKLHDVAAEHKTPFLFETTVGAALPILSTLRDLRATGDHIHSIEAVLSGTLSYIFNSFCASDRPFSDIVREAKELGYTEPDPRDDLSGLDVVRKVLILARENDIPLDLSDVQVEPILPRACFDASSIEEFFKTLEGFDSLFDKKRKEARVAGRVLRCIANIEQDGTASLALRSVDMTNPFSTLAGSDNMIVFHTDRYSQTPLVVRGPGAGAAVTAAGVLADALRIYK